MREFALVWLAVAATVFMFDMLDPRSRRGLNPLFAAFSALIWPIYLPLGAWVAANPRKAERIRQRFGTKEPTNG